jgi:hypothetical protein
MTAVTAVIGEPAERTNLSVWEGLKNSKLAALAWTAMRVWLGVMWIQAGSAKLWGAEAARDRHRDPGHVADLKLDRRRRPDLRLPAAPPEPVHQPPPPS